jgi:hypothetical protein
MVANALFYALVAVLTGAGLAGIQPYVDVESLQDTGFTLAAKDLTHGAGGEITVTFELPQDAGPVDRIVIERTSAPDSGFESIAEVGPDAIRYPDSMGIQDGRLYYYRARAVRPGQAPLVSGVFGPVETRGLWFKPGALFTCTMSLLVILVVFLFLYLARRGRSMFIRSIPGLKAVEEAIGRATEMGKPILYCSGVADLRCPGVLASLTVLGWVAEKVATYGAALTYPVNNALNLTAGQEIVKESYLRAGRPELYKDDMVFFISGEQFAYAAAVCGLMEREQTAAHLFFGSFWSETLVLTESGAATGAMQIAATDSEHQIPFMVATCDYVIIGEEFYAASAYLSQDPTLKGSLKAQDLVKAVIILLILLGVILATLERAFDMNISWFFDFWRL